VIGGFHSFILLMYLVVGFLFEFLCLLLSVDGSYSYLLSSLNLLVVRQFGTYTVKFLLKRRRATRAYPLPMPIDLADEALGANHRGRAPFAVEWSKCDWWSDGHQNTQVNPKYPVKFGLS
jgi:hypothetical protein